MCTMEKVVLEHHPWKPFLPDGCRLLMLGSFPPARKRWAMDFFYPNFTNDFWRICGICFHGDKLHYDKDLEVVEPTDVAALLRLIPQCQAVCTTGQKATDVFCQQLAIAVQPSVGSYVEFTFDNRQLRLYRMPSSSRAYPMAVERKAEFYRPMFEDMTK